MAEADAWPSRVGRYEIILPIASGGLATVYLARAQGPGGFDRYLALKVTAAHLRDDPTFSSQLIEEAKLVAHLRHTNVVQAFDVGESEHGVFLVMEYVPGDSLAGLRNLAREQYAEKDGKLPRSVSIKILADALVGLHAAHEHADEAGRPLHLVHRDFSPQNILVGTDGIARLTDFGIAKAASRESATGTGFIKGKLRYVAPEQVRGEVLDRRCDIWAAGVIAWEVLAGRSLYDKDDRSILEGSREEPPRVKTIASDVTDELDEVVRRALCIDREQRFPSAQLFARELVNAATAAGMLADADEVAEHVVRLTGPELAERKALLAETRRHKRPLSAPDVRTMIGMEGPLPLKRAPLPSLPEVPPEVDDGSSELRIEVDLKAKRSERANLDILGDAGAPVSEPEPHVFRSPLGGPDAPDEKPIEWPADASALDGHEKASLPGSTTGITTRVLEGARPWFSPPWTTKKISVGAALAGGALGFVIVLVAISCGGPKPSASAAIAASSASARGPGREPAPATPATEGSAAAASAAPSEQARVLQIKANGPIASVRVADRLIDAVVPAPTIEVELEDEEREKTLRITVTGTDGRVAVGTAEPTATELGVTFEKPRPRVSAPPPATTTKHPWMKHR